MVAEKNYISDGARRVEVRSSLIYQKIVLHGIDIWDQDRSDKVSQTFEQENISSVLPELLQSATKWVETLRPKLGFFTFYELQKEEI